MELVNHKLLGWIITTQLYREIQKPNIKIKMMLVNRKLLGWTITAPRNTGIKYENVNDAGKP